jgi:poly(A) polymerase
MARISLAQGVSNLEVTREAVPAREAVPERIVPLVESVSELATLFERAGHKLYLVGGTVRDAVFLAGNPANVVEIDRHEEYEEGDLGREDDLDRLAEGTLSDLDSFDPDALDADVDLTTDALPDQIEAIVSKWADSIWLQGKRFGTIACRRNGKLYEITTHRKEVYPPDSRKPEVVFGKDVETDLSRRDFTINAMALRLPDLQLIDPYGGLEDLAVRRLRTPLAPEVSFSEDPLRMLRAARFIATFELEPDAELVEAVKADKARLSVVSAERIRDEFNKLITVRHPAAGLRFIVDTGLAEVFLPELPALALEQDPLHRHKDVLAHTIAVVEKARPDKILRLAALFHDIGKPKTRAFGPDGLVTFYHHELVGAKMTAKRLQALRYSNSDIAQVTRLVELHLRFHTYRMGWTDKAVRRYVRDAGPLLERLNELTRCDCTTRDRSKALALSRRIDELEERIRELRAKEELDRIRPDLDGNQVMTLLNIPPGPMVGKALEFLLELRLDEGPLGEEEATKRLMDWWKQQQ